MIRLDLTDAEVRLLREALNTYQCKREVDESVVVAIHEKLTTAVEIERIREGGRRARRIAILRDTMKRLREDNT